MGDIKFSCRVCKQSLVIDADGAAKSIRCPTCGAMQTVPVPERNGKESAEPAGKPEPQFARRAGEDAEVYQYEAFISYRHVEPDRTWAKWLHNAIETYRTPQRLIQSRGLPGHLRHVFRDEEELPASADLSREIEQGLQCSRFLIVICSPRTPQSAWVNAEVVKFRELGRHDRILALLIEGEPSQAFPNALREIRHAVADGSGQTRERIELVEPLAADVRPRPGESAREMRRLAKLRMLACILGVPFDDLRQRELERRIRKLTLAGIAMGLLITLMGALSAIAVYQRHSAVTMSNLAQQRELTAFDERAKAEAAARKESDAKAQAEQALLKLRETAPAFHAVAKSRLDEGKYDEAIEKIGYAIQLDDANADYHLFRANLFEALQRLAEAIAEYNRVLILRSNDEVAKVNLALCERWLSENGNASTLRKELQKELLDALRTQGRLVEAGPLNAIFEPDIAIAEATLNARLHEYIKQAGWNDMKRVARLPDGTFSLDLTHLTLGDLSNFKGIPISSLILCAAAPGSAVDPTAILKGLAGLPLRTLDISQWRSLTDISPLRGLPLVNLKLDQTKVTDLTPLSGMKLHDIILGYTPVSDLSPLAGMPLDSLDLRFTQVADLTPLRGAPIKSISVWKSQVVDISPLAGAPLHNLELLQTGVADLSPLTNCFTLKKLSIYATKVSDLSPLAKLKLNELKCMWNKVTTLEPLRGQPLREISISGLRVTDLSPLADCPTLEVILLNTAAKNVEVLRKLPRLKLISRRMSGWGPAQTAAEFWKEYDATKAMGGKR